MKRIGLVGLGLMGLPMAENWIKKGFSLTFLAHKRREPAEKLKSLGAKEASDLKTLADLVDVIVLMVPTSREVEEICLTGTQPLLKILKPQHIVIDMSTSAPDSTRLIHKSFNDVGLRFFDAPVTGGVGGAAQGTLTLFVGGPEAWFEECREVLAAVSKLQTHFGPAGQGHVAKLINNMICIGNLAVFSEALPLAMAAGLDLEAIFKTLLSGTASSEMLKFYGPQIIAGDFAPRFKLGHAAKDLDLAVDLSKSFGVDLPVLLGAKDLFDEARTAGLSEKNLSAVISNIGKDFKPPLFNSTAKSNIRE